MITVANARQMVIETINDLKPRISNITLCCIEGACSREEATGAIDLVIAQMNSAIPNFPDLKKELNDMLEFCLQSRSKTNICS